MFAQGTETKPVSPPPPGLEEAGVPAAAGGKAGSGRPAAGAGPATGAERFPYRYVGLGGTGGKPEFLALTDGVTSIVARVGDVVGDRYRIDELRAEELVLTDLDSRDGGIVVPYADIQYRPPEAPAPEVPASSQTRKAVPTPPLEFPSAGSPLEAARPSNPEAPASRDIPEADIRTMIAPPPVDRGNQPMPMEVTPPPQHNPMVVTPPAQDVPMITTPARREHQESVDIPLGPGN